MTSGGGQDWRGGRTPRNVSGKEEAAVPSWKKSRHSTTAKSGAKGFRLKLQIAFASVILIGLIGIIIWFWNPQQVHRTHFVILNLLEQSQDFDASLPMTLPKGIEVKTTRRLVTECHPETLALQTSNSADRDNLNAGQTLVIWLQTTFVPASNGQFLCLIRNSTPNLNDSSQYVPLETLKSQLEEFRNKHANVNVLLLVDSVPTNSAWRTGFLHANLVDEFEQWTTDLKTLVVVLSSPVSGLSEPGQTGSDGKSVFGHFASVGLSTFADLDQNQNLTTFEFCSYVAEQTDRWVREHRDVAGQAVTVLPSLEKLSNGNHNFTVVDELIPLKSGEESPNRRPNADSSQIENLWVRRQSLQARGGHLWNPLLWNSASDDLLRGERAFLTGKVKASEHILTEVERTLRELESLTDSLCPEADLLLADRGIAFSEFNTLPSLNRIRHLFKTETVKLDSNDVPALCEDVVVSLVRGFPYGDLNLTAPQDVAPIRTRRSAAESTVAQLLRCSDQVANTVKRMEASLLLSEDRLFHRSTGTAAPSSDANPDPLITALRDFTEARDRADTTLFAVLDLAPSLAYWAADTCRILPDSDRKTWHSVLSSNTPEADLTSASLNSMFDSLKGIGADERDHMSDYERDATDMRAEIFKYLAFGRALQQSLLISEPPTGFNVDELQTLIAKLNSTQDAAARSQHRIQELAESLCASALDEKPAKRAGQVEVYHFLRSTLSLTVISAETRIGVLRALRQWDEKLVSPVAVSETADHDDKVAASRLSFATDEALWMLQLLNLVPKSENQLETLTITWRAAKELELGEASSEHDAAARFGESIRKIWQQNQENVIAALQDTTSKSQGILRIADQQSRLFSAFDTRSRALRSPMGRLRQLNRIQYCLMHADRLLTGLWIEPKDSAPLVQDGWYAKLTRPWLKAATESIQTLAKEPLGVPVTVSDALRKLETRLNDSEQLRLSFVTEPNQHFLDLGEQATVTGTIGGHVNMTGCANVPGEVTVLVRVNPNSAIEVENNAFGVRVGSAPADVSLRFRRRGNPGTSNCNSVSLTPETFFRGRFSRSDGDISVNPCAPAEFTIEKPARPLTASVKVSGADPRPVALILDYSQSMTELLSSERKLKKVAALETLKTVINDEVLTGARVILFVYGHRTKYYDGTVKIKPNETYRKAFSNRPFSDLLPPEEDIENVFDYTIDGKPKRDTFENTLNMFDDVEPWGTTPLIGALTKAIREIGKQGIVIAVTDGEAKDMYNSRLVTLTKILEENPATSVHLVAFDLQKKIEAVPELGAKTELDRLKSAFQQFPTIGIENADKPGDLIKEITKSLRPGKFWVNSSSANRNDSAELGVGIENLTPGDDYSVTFDRMESPKPLVLNHGDRLNLILDRIGKRFVFGREKSSVWKASSGSNSTNGSPTMLVSIAPPRLSDLPDVNDSGIATAQLSLMLDHERDDLPVRQPAEIEFQVRPASAESTYRPHVVHQIFGSRTGAPGWDLKIDEWPKEQLFLVDAIWKMDRTPPNYVLQWDELVSFDAISTALQIKQNGLPDCSAWVTLRGTTLEIRLDPTETEPQPKRPLFLGDEMARNRVADVRIEIGEKGTSDQNASFLPWEIDTKVVRLQTGSVRYVFSGDRISPENLSHAQVALTSSAARRAGATEVQGFRVE